MKYLVLFWISFISVSNAQEKYWTRSGILIFEASMPAFEDVRASNENVTAILNTEDGTFAVLALVKGFRFKNALMEEHFNESYIESNLYPKAIFKGKLLDFNLQELNKTYTLSGTLELHGQTNIGSVKMKINQEKQILNCKGIFTVNAADYNIEIPKIVRNKVNDKVTIDIEFQLIKKSD